VVLSPSSDRHDLSKRHLSFAFLLVFASTLNFAPSLATELQTVGIHAQARIAVSTELVLLPVKVTNAQGKFVSGLKLEDFRVYEDGQQVKPTVFEEGDVPVTVGLVVDHSRSMGSKLSGVVAAVSSFTHSSNPQDEMFVVDFNDDVSIELMKGKAFSNDAKELGEALTAVSARGRTALYDAVSEGLHHLQYGHKEKKALVIISDGGDNASHLKYAQVLKQARETQALIYSIALVGGDEEENPELLRRLCKDTGGIAYFPRQGESVASASAEIARDLREQYTVGYVPQDLKRGDTFRKVEVKVTAENRGKLRVRTRQGYSLKAQKEPVAQLAPETE
jgi:Ca-activated chloride channel family protein